MYLGREDDLSARRIESTRDLARATTCAYLKTAKLPGRQMLRETAIRQMFAKLIE